MVADAGGGDLDERLAGTGTRRLDLLEAEAVQRPGLLQYDGFHGGNGRPRHAIIGRPPGLMAGRYP